jgi:F-type H+-transporting ATPase subunit b
MANETAHTEVPGGGEHVFPPFDKQTFPSQLFWLTLTFVALYVLMARVALPRIGSILEERRERISGDLAEASRLKGESDAAAAAYEKALADARGRAQAVVTDSRQREAEKAEAARKTLDASLNARIAEAERRIAEITSAAMVNVRGIAVEAATAIVERLAGTVAVGRDAIEGAVAEALER